MYPAEGRSEFPQKTPPPDSRNPGRSQIPWWVAGSSFNGKPKAIFSGFTDACGLPLNDER
jgi:hypothetical protein